jgi:REP element-mobilizing transposase RayT
MDQFPYRMDAARRAIVLRAIQEVCEHRGWVLHAAHVRSNHVHIVMYAEEPPERVMNIFKTIASRRLNEASIDSPNRKRWARHGSTRWLWKPEQLTAAMNYVIGEQGTPMSTYDEAESEPRP